MKRFLVRVFDRVMDVEDADPGTALGLGRLVLSGTLALGVGIGIAARGYVMSGLKWPKARV